MASNKFPHFPHHSPHSQNDNFFKIINSGNIELNSVFLYIDFLYILYHSLKTNIYSGVNHGLVCL